MMTPKEKKEYAILAVLVLATFVVIWWNFIRKPGVVAPPPGMQAGVPIAADPNALPGGGAVVPAAGMPGMPGATAGMGAASTFLPYGTELKTDILKQDRFKSLNDPVYPTVTKDEVGSTNPFK